MEIAFWQANKKRVESASTLNKNDQRKKGTEEFSVEIKLSSHMN
jgi:hypothetical protein